MITLEQDLKRLIKEKKLSEDVAGEYLIK